MISCQQMNEYVKIELQGRLDVQSGPEIEAVLLELLNDEKKKLLMDFEKVNYVSSSGLRSLLAILKQCKKQSAHCVLAALQPAILNIFDMSGFSSLFDIYETVEEAEKNLK